jgi:hypothetical protein
MRANARLFKAELSFKADEKAQQYGKQQIKQDPAFK